MIYPPTTIYPPTFLEYEREAMRQHDLYTARMYHASWWAEWSARVSELVA